MNILMIAPDRIRSAEARYKFLRNVYPIVGINYLATILKQRGHCVRCLDTLSEYTFSNFEPSVKIMNGVIKEINQLNPQVIGISTLTPFRKMVFEIARFIKRGKQEIKIILGGPHITIIKEHILERYKNLIDVLVIGEGEETLPELIEALEGKRNLQSVKGIAYIDSKGEIIKTPPRPEIIDLDKIPFPNYDQYIEFLQNRRLPTAAILTSRGCSYQCSFCSSSLLWKKRRIRSPENVVKEIECLVSKYGVEEIRIWDDTFGFDKEQAIGIFKLLVENHIKVRIGYLNTRFDVMDEEILYWYKKARGTGIFYGLESGSEKVRENMGKYFTNNKVREVAKVTKKLGLRLGLFLIFGYPGETPTDVKQTYKLVKELQPDQVICNLPNIYPGTMLFKQAMQEGKVNFKNWLEEEPEYFPYSDSEEIKGYIALFSQIFNKKTPIRTEFENIVYDYFNNDPSYLRKVKEKARKKLIEAEAKL